MKHFQVGISYKLASPNFHKLLLEIYVNICYTTLMTVTAIV